MRINSGTELTAARFDVRSADGTPIAVWVDGTGPALVMVHGSIADHTTFGPFVAVLRQPPTTYCMDRRGFGASGDTADTRSNATSTLSPPSSTVRDATTRAAAAIRNARIHALDGHDPFAHKTDPAIVTTLVQQFIAQ